MSENQGERGPTGESGVAGRQGEAGVSGPQGEAGVTGERGPAGAGEPGEAGKTGQPGPTGRSFSGLQVLALFFLVLVAFISLSIRTEIQQRQISNNSNRIEHVLLENARTQHDICTTRNAAVVKQNALIDQAIAAEKRRPVPDQIRIRGLVNFKGATPNCGARP